MKTKEDYLIAKGLTTSNSFERFFMNDVLQAMQEYADQSKWVSVEEMPNEGQIVDTWNGVSNRRAQFIKGAYQRHVDRNDWDRILVVIYPDVTHWQPLPTPPQS